MSLEQESGPLRICCECGKWHSVKVTEAGSVVTRWCGCRVEVPLLEEFRDRPDLLSAATVERRILRLIRAGELPLTDRCTRCGDANSTDVVPVKLDCESSVVRHHGGLRFLFLPFMFWIYWREEEWVEVHGHDTVVPTPVCLCTGCQSCLRERKRSAYLWLPFLLIPLGGLAGYFHFAAGLGIAVTGLLTGLLGILLWRRWEFRAWQETLKNTLRRVPVYRQMLASYPEAFVFLPPSRETRAG